MQEGAYIESVSWGKQGGGEVVSGWIQVMGEESAMARVMIQDPAEVWKAGVASSSFDLQQVAPPYPCLLFAHLSGSRVSWKEAPGCTV